MPLAVAVTGDISAFQKAMAAASTVAAKAAQGIAEDFVVSKLKIDRAFSGLGPKLAAGLLIGAAVYASWQALSAAIGQATKEMEKLLELERLGRQAGVSPDFAKAFTEATKETRVETDALARSLASAGEATRTTFSKLSTVGEFLKQVYGDVHERVLAFQAATPEQKIILAVSAMRDLLATGNQLAALDLAEKMGMRELAVQIRAGRANLEEFQAKLVEGAAAQAAQARHATELNDRLADANAKIKEFLGVSFSLVDLGFRLKETWVAIVETIAAATDRLKQLQALARSATGVTPEVAAALGIKPDAKRIYDQTAGPDLPPEMRAREALRQQLGSQAAREAAAAKSLEMAKEVRPDGKKATPAASTAEAETALERATRQAEERIALMKTEIALVNDTVLKRETALELEKLQNAAKRDGVTLEGASLAAAQKTAEAYGQQAAKLAEVRAAQQKIVELQNFVGNMLVDSLMQATEAGAKLSDIMANVAKQIARAALQALILGQGPLAGLFGTTTGGNTGQVGGLVGGASALLKALPKYADGGVVPGTGPQLAMVHGGETIIPKGGGAGGPIMINQTIDARGAQAGVADQ